MASASLFARAVARHSFDKALRLRGIALGNVRFASSYFTPGMDNNKPLCWIPVVYLTFRLWFQATQTLCIDMFPAHEYCQVDGNIATCGITDFAQSALGDIVFVDLPGVGDVFEKGDAFGSVESVKAASDVYAPVSGKITEINETLVDEPGMVNSDAEGVAWFIKLEMSDASELGALMEPDAYKKHCEEEAH